MQGLAVSPVGVALAGALWLCVPMLLILVARVWLRAHLLVSVLGAVTFVLAWCGSVVTAGLLGATGVASGGWLWALAISCSAGICEETMRYLVFRTSYMRARESWNTTAMHTLGHAGIESVIECLTIAFSLALVVYGAGLVPAEELQRLREMTNGDLLFMAGLRVVMGPVIHGVFATFVAAAVAKGRPQLWLAAIGLHAGHDIVAHRIGDLGQTVSYVWLAASLVGYAGVIVWLRQRWFVNKSPTG